MRYVLLWLPLVFLPAPRTSAQVGQVHARGWLHLNGYSHHFAADDASSLLFGVGGSWYTKGWGKILRSWEADVYRDSGAKLSAHVGHAWTYQSRFANLGVTGSLIYHRNFAAHNRWRILPVLLPYAEIPLGGQSLRVYYIPPVRNRSDHQLAIQLLVPLWR